MSRTASPGRSCAARSQADAVSTADHGVAAGHGVVGEEDHGLAARRAPGPRRAPSPRWAARRRARRRPGAPGAPVSRSPTRSLSAGDDAVRPEQAAEPGRPAADPGGPGAGQHLEHGRPVVRGDAAGRRGRPWGSVGPAPRPAAGRRPRTGGGPRPGQRVGRPRPQHRRHVDAAAHGEVGAQARGRHPEGEDGAVGHLDEGGVGDRPAVDGRRRRGAGEATVTRPRARTTEAAEQHLERRAVLGVPDQPGPEPVGRAVGGAGAAHPDGGQARAAGVLDEHERRRWPAPRGPGSRRAASASTKRTVVPGPSRAGGSRSTSHSTASVVPTSCQPPGEDARVDPGELPGQARPTRRAPTGGAGRAAAPAAAGRPRRGRRTRGRSRRRRPATACRCGRRRPRRGSGR